MLRHFPEKIDAMCAIILAVLALVSMATGGKWKLIFIEVLNAVFLFVALLLGNIMAEYLAEIRMDYAVLALYILLNLFILAYLIYYIFWHALELKYKKPAPAPKRRRRREAL